MSLRLLILSTVLVAAVPALAYDQPPVYMPTADTDSMLVLIEIRDLADIEHDLEEAAAERAAAEVRETQAKMLQARSVTKIKIKESEITSLKAELDQAKAQKDEVKKIEFENQKKFAEMEATLLKRRDDLRKSEMEFARAEAEFHAAEAAGYESELKLAHLRSQRTGLDGVVASKGLYEEAQKLVKEIRDTEGKTLDAKVKAAEKQKSMSERAVQITKSRKKVYEATRKLVDAATK